MVHGLIRRLAIAAGLGAGMAALTPSAPLMGAATGIHRPSVADGAVPWQTPEFGRSLQAAFRRYQPGSRLLDQDQVLNLVSDVQSFELGDPAQLARLAPLARAIYARGFETPESIAGPEALTDALMGLIQRDASASAWAEFREAMAAVRDALDDRSREEALRRLEARRRAWRFYLDEFEAREVDDFYVEQRGRSSREASARLNQAMQAAARALGPGQGAADESSLAAAQTWELADELRLDPDGPALADLVDLAKDGHPEDERVNLIAIKALVDALFKIRGPESESRKLKVLKVMAGLALKPGYLSARKEFTRAALDYLSRTRSMGAVERAILTGLETLAREGEREQRLVVAALSQDWVDDKAATEWDRNARQEVRAALNRVRSRRPKPPIEQRVSLALKPLPKKLDLVNLLFALPAISGALALAGHTAFALPALACFAVAVELGLVAWFGIVSQRQGKTFTHLLLMSACFVAFLAKSGLILSAPQAVAIVGLGGILALHAVYTMLGPDGRDRSGTGLEMSLILALVMMLMYLLWALSPPG